MSTTRLLLKSSVFISLCMLIVLMFCIIYAQYTAAVVLIGLSLFLVMCMGYYVSTKIPDEKEIVFIPRSKIKIMGYELKEVKLNHK